MRIFINKTGSLTVVDKILVYELKIDRKAALAIVETHLRGSVEGATDQQKAATKAVHAIIVCAFGQSDCRVGNRHELEATDDPRLRMVNVNPSGKASPVWSLGQYI